MNDEQILTILSEMTFKDNLAYLNCGDLDRTDYVKVDNILKTLKGKWKGGRTQAHIFPYNPEKIIKTIVKSGQLPSNELDFFYTPDKVVDEIFVEINLFPVNGRVLEPSAGTGGIAKRLLTNYPEIELDMVEIDPINLILLKDNVKGGNIIQQDFLVFQPKYKYDLIVMNPPFNGTNGDYIDHINHAFELLAVNGQLISIVPGDYKKWQQYKKGKQFFEMLCDNDVQWFELEDGAFKESGTNIKCSVISITKQRDIWKRNNYSGFPSWYVWCASIWSLNSQKAWQRWENAIKILERSGHIVNNEASLKGIEIIDTLFNQVEDGANASGEALYLNTSDRVALANWIISQMLNTD